MKEQEYDRVTDQGWAAMQRLLDQRMPRRRRRVAGWWWLTGLLLLPAIGITGWQFYERSIETVPAPAGPVVPAAPLAGQGLQRSQPDHADPGTVAGSTADQPQRVVQNREWEKQDAVRRPVHTRPDGITATGFSLLAMPEAPLPQTAGQPTGAEAESGATENTLGAGTPALAALPTVPPDLERSNVLDFQPYPPYTSPEIVRKSPRQPTWSLGLLAGLTSERLPRVNGGVGGMVADWQPLRRWGVRGGLQYAMQRLAVDESLVTAISEEAYENTSNNLGLFDNSGNYGTIGDFSSINTDILASVRRIHRIEAPVLAFWQPLRALRVYAGASLNHTFLAQTSSKILADNQVFKVATGRDEINRLATERLQTWQVKWQGGLGYRMGRRAEINAYVHTTFPKISFQKKAEMQADLKVADRQSNSFGQVRQLGVTLSGIVFF